MSTVVPRRRSPAWEQYVDAPEKWANDHLWLLTAVFNAFARDGEWPPVETVQRTLADVDTARAVAVARLVIDIPAELGAREGDRIALRCRALSYCDAAAGLLSRLVEAIRLAAEVYRASDAEHPPVLSGFALKARLELDDPTYVRTSRLLFQEGWFFGGGSGDVHEDWQRKVSVGVLLAENVIDIGDYLDCVARYRFGEPYIVDARAQDRRVIKLERDWEIGEQIGEGGFGRVFAASANGEEAVAKFVPKQPGAARELLFVDLGPARNVIPVIDHGESEESWVLVMPRADLSLRDLIDETGAPLGSEDVQAILTDVATTLVDLAGNVVHRDIKPENVLRFSGHWCLADFGISRYTEATTAPDTHKFAMSPPYAAPERWRSERATAAADVYALGVMGYEMLGRALPFPGPSLEDFRDQHLHTDPPPLDCVDTSLASAIEACLIKAPGARPLPDDLLARLSQAAIPPASSGLARLREVSRVQAQQIATEARRASEASTEQEQRESLFAAASRSLDRMSNNVIEAIVAVAPTAERRTHADGRRSIKLGPAELAIFQAQPTTGENGIHRIPFDIAACSDVELSMAHDHYGYEGRSHALWFCDAQEAGRYSWFETAFMVQPLMARQSNRDPFSLKPGAEAGAAVGHGVGAFQVAWPFTRFDDESLQAFINRWAGWLADAAEGHLHRPSTMPEKNPEGSWRRD
jgi:serine/threonine-protein kinase